MDWRVRLPGAIYRQAVDRAGSDADLARLVVAYLTTYVDGTSAQSLGGRARAAALSDEERRAHARRMAAARWQRTP